jgi:hypothetical protein
MRSALASPLPYHAFTMPAEHSVAVGRGVVGKSAMYDRAVDALAGGNEPKRRKLQNLSLLFYRPLALATNRLYVPMVGLALAAAVLASTRWGRTKLAPASQDGRGAGWRFAPLLCLIALQSGVNLTVATSHSHAVLRYRMAQYPLTFLVVATALLTVAALLAAYRDNARRR